MPRSSRRSRLGDAPLEERRYVLGSVSARSGADDRTFNGHAAVFGQRTAIGDPFRWGFFEQCSPGMFTKTLQEADVIFDQDHDPSRVMARSANGTLRLSEDAEGLAVNADLADVSYVRDLVTLLDRGDVRGMSFMFQVVQDEWTSEEAPYTMPDGRTQLVTVDVRTLKEVRLYDVCTTAMPAYPQTDAGMRSAVAAAMEATHRRGVSLVSPRRVALALRTADAARAELRDGALTTDTLDALQQVLDLIVAADAAVDEAQPLLAAVLGVPNPDEPEDAPDEDDDARSGEPGDETTHHSQSGPEPVSSTRYSRNQLTLTMRALSARYGLSLPTEGGGA